MADIWFTNRCHDATDMYDAMEAIYRRMQDGGGSTFESYRGIGPYFLNAVSLAVSGVFGQRFKGFAHVPRIFVYEGKQRKYDRICLHTEATILYKTGLRDPLSDAGDFNIVFHDVVSRVKETIRDRWPDALVTMTHSGGSRKGRVTFNISVYLLPDGA